MFKISAQRTERIRLLQSRCTLGRLLLVFQEGRLATGFDAAGLVQRPIEDDQPPFHVLACP